MDFLGDEQAARKIIKQQFMLGVSQFTLEVRGNGAYFGDCVFEDEKEDPTRAAAEAAISTIYAELDSRKTRIVARLTGNKDYTIVAT